MLAWVLRGAYAEPYATPRARLSSFVWQQVPVSARNPCRRPTREPGNLNHHGIIRYRGHIGKRVDRLIEPHQDEEVANTGKQANREPDPADQQKRLGARFWLRRHGWLVNNLIQPFSARTQLGKLLV